MKTVKIPTIGFNVKFGRRRQKNDCASPNVKTRLTLRPGRGVVMPVTCAVDCCCESSGHLLSVGPGRACCAVWVTGSSACSLHRQTQDAPSARCCSGKRGGRRKCRSVRERSGLVPTGSRRRTRVRACAVCVRPRHAGGDRRCVPV